MEGMLANVVSLCSLLLYIVPCRSIQTVRACQVCSCNQKLALVRCANLAKFPEVSSFPVNTTSLYVLHSELTHGVPTDQLHQLNKLKYLYLQYNKIKNVTTFGPSNLIILHLDHNVIETIEPGAFDELQQLSELSLAYNKLTTFPRFSRPLKLSNLFLRGNKKITRLSRKSLQNLPFLQNLYLEETGITDIPNAIFQRNKELLKIDLAGTTSLTSINEDAFDGASSLQSLLLDNTRITSLPQQGLENLRYLSLKNVPNIWQLPPRLWNIQEVHVSQYNGFLCCAFDLNVYKKNCATQLFWGQTTTSSPTITMQSTETSGYTQSPSSDPTSTVTTTNSGSGQWTWPSGFVTPAPTTAKSGSTSSGIKWTFPGGSVTPAPTTAKSGSTSSGIKWTFPGGGSFTSAHTPTSGGGGGFVTAPASFPTHKVNTFTFPNVHNTTVIPSSVIPHGNQSNASVYQCPKVPINVKCYPKPDAFHPCEDIMGYTLLTAVSFMVGAVALVANLVVALVVVTSQRRFNVTRFLMCNLALADFLLGLYIFILACFSINTHSEYYNYVRRWQHGLGCKILGFLAVFSSELSLFTLVVMTVERFYAIVYAMHLNARLSFRKSVRTMIGGWVFAFVMAAIPLTGVNSYSKVAICLPFDVSDTGSKAYVALLLVINCVSFIVVVYLYAKMLLVVRQGGGMEGAPKRNDSKVAKRMAALVFTDMACLAPIAFFGILAAFGAPLINVTQSKILLVFFFPINSVCNPFLYSFFTKAFKREFFALLNRFGFCKFRALKYNGTLSSFMYSRSRRNQSTNDDRSKRISTVSSPSYDFRRSTIDLVGAGDSKATLQMNCMSNLAYTPEPPQTTTTTNARFSINAIEHDDVFAPTSPNQPPSNTNSPKSILKKTSVISENSIKTSTNDVQEEDREISQCNVDQQVFAAYSKATQNDESRQVNCISNMAYTPEPTQTTTTTSTQCSNNVPEMEHEVQEEDREISQSNVDQQAFAADSKATGNDESTQL